MLVGRYLEDGCPEEDGVLMLNWGRGKGQTCRILCILVNVGIP